MDPRPDSFPLSGCLQELVELLYFRVMALFHEHNVRRMINRSCRSVEFWSPVAQKPVRNIWERAEKGQKR